MPQTCFNTALQSIQCILHQSKHLKKISFLCVFLSFHPQGCRVDYFIDSEVVVKPGSILGLSGLNIWNGVDRLKQLCLLHICAHTHTHKLSLANNGIIMD